MAKRDAHLVDALVKAYTSRAQIFHRGVQIRQIDLLLSEIDSIDAASLLWNPAALSISRKALAKVRMAEGALHQVFAHPTIISTRPHLIAYYRNLVTLSKKGIAQILFPTERFESGLSKEISSEKANELCNTLNRMISAVIEDIPKYKVGLSRQALLAELGTELQGTWANLIGKGAAKAVEEILNDYITRHALGRRVRDGYFELKNGWTIMFASEPDVAFVDSEGVTRIAIEIKGSLDTAGAQTRYGEAKKSFGKQIKENPRCHTLYLASCFTDAVIEQIKADGQVRAWANLTSVLSDDDVREQFLDEIFHVVNAPTRRRNKG